MTTRTFSRQQTKTRNAIIRAALRLLLANGYETLTVTAIINEADYGCVVFYQYFKDKDDIVLEILSKWFINLSNQVTYSVQHLESPEREYSAWQQMVNSIKASPAHLRKNVR